MICRVAGVEGRVGALVFDEDASVHAATNNADTATDAITDRNPRLGPRPVTARAYDLPIQFSQHGG